eukprot:TRINITY_DN4986_c0_g2_i1.p1 TRINITY_DN4986_c0_g2~~TRINITY_DN4986_c0_g2_i1.p1  ORF type:complete len:322 (-),score=69.48 TRINITY_DN4986_c0_g2_i1:1-900(-)
MEGSAQAETTTTTSPLFGGLHKFALTVFEDHVLFTVPAHDGAATRGEVFLMDTGSPLSIGSTKRHTRGCTLFPGGPLHRMTKSYIGRTVPILCEMLNTTIDALIGINVLQYYFFAVSFKRACVWFSAELPQDDAEAYSTKDLALMHTVELQWTGSVPQVKLSINHEPEFEAYIDSGAKVSYIRKSYVDQLTPLSETAEDFFPGVGRWTTKLYFIDVQVTAQTTTTTTTTHQQQQQHQQRLTIPVKFGVLPPQLERMMLGTGDPTAILGSDLFHCFDTVAFALPQQRMYLSPAPEKKNKA